MKRKFESKEQKQEYQLYKKYIFNLLKHNSLSFDRLNSLHNVALFLAADEDPYMHQIFYNRAHSGLYEE